MKGIYMSSWNIESLRKSTANFDSLSPEQQTAFLTTMNSSFPPSVFSDHLAKRHSALRNMNNSRIALDGASQHYPETVDWETIHPSPKALNNFAIVFTAGGEGERLRLSLQKLGTPPALLSKFTKATHPLPDFFEDFGTLQTNLAMISSFCSEYSIDIPVIVTTGPANSVTATVIPELLNKFNNFGLRHLKTVAQEERLHFTNDEKIVCHLINGVPFPVTQPDETGGPLMKLKQNTDTNNGSIINWLTSLGCTKMIIVQATALYDKRLLPTMAQALQSHDCLGVGILRKDFPTKDPFGTFVTLQKKDQCTTMILEQDVRNETTRTIKDPSGKYYLPFNTGFYALEISLLQNFDLPDYATPPKEITPEYPRSPKVGYAATDLLPLARDPLILTITAEMFGVLKTADDLEVLSNLGKNFGLNELCKNVISSI